MTFDAWDPNQMRDKSRSHPRLCGVGSRWPNCFQGFPPRVESVRVGSTTWQLIAHGRPTSWGINLTPPLVRWVGGRYPKFV